MKRIFEHFIALLAFTLLIGFCPSAYATDNIIDIVVFGDSLTSGYQLQPEEAFPAKLLRKLKEVGFTNVSVKNMSVAGETTAGGVERLDRIIAGQPEIVILELGSNDALRGIGPEIVNANLAQMLDKLQRARVSVILVGTKAPANMGYSYGAQFDAMYRKLAKSYGAALYPFILEGVVGKEELNLGDGIHPNAKGVEVMVNNMYPTIDAMVRARYEMMRYQMQYEQQQRNMQDQMQYSQP